MNPRKKTEINLIVKLDDVLSGISMISSNSSKSYGHFYLRKCTVDLDKVLYKLQVEDKGSVTGKDFEAPVNKITTVYDNLEDL